MGDCGRNGSASRTGKDVGLVGLVGRVGDCGRNGKAERAVTSGTGETSGTSETSGTGESASRTGNCGTGDTSELYGQLWDGWGVKKRFLFVGLKITLIFVAVKINI